MNDDLISRSKLIEDIEKMVKEQCMSNPNITLLNAGEIIDKIYEQPTAFDVNKVISKIWDKSELIHIKHEHNDEVEDYIRVTDATEIVREGGIDEV